MIRRLPYRLPLLPLLFLIIAGCGKDNGLEELPDLAITLKPEKGVTTDVFALTIEPIVEGKSGTTLFYRWDWDNDGTWDIPFTTSQKAEHRFMKAGTREILLEYSDGAKQVKTKVLTLVVAQGYSEPHPLFTVTPGTGNILTTFVFDASSTLDDEDSLSQLKFRWDFRENGNWTTEFSASPKATWKYEKARRYHPRMQAIDPSGKTAICSTEVIVNMIDSLIIADFALPDSLIRVGDTINLDASGSRYPNEPDRVFLFSWLLPGSVEWTDPVPESGRRLILGSQGQKTISLKAIDEETGLYNQVTKELYVAEENLPPRAKIQVGSVYGNIATTFYFDSWSCTDDNQPPSDLEVRWDYNGDGNYDTPYTKEKVVYHQYDLPGEYYVALQVRDNQYVTAKDVKRIIVSPNSNPTSFFKDLRDGNFYGAVKIGDQWWMSQNLNYQIPDKLLPRNYLGELQMIFPWLCLFEQSKWCDQVGKLYRIGAFVENRADDEFLALCPTGWRLPSQRDWETLIATIGGEQHGKELRMGGRSDFNALDLGYATYEVLWKGTRPYDTLFHFKETFEKAWFFSTTEPYDINHLRTDIWMLNLDRAMQSLWVGHGSTTIYMPVRCIKED
ncbi:MAG: FISUMP domain-containing protein [Bacteroidota bacterium]